MTDDRTNLILSRVQRITELSSVVLDRMDKREPLSSILAQARAVADLHGSTILACWLDLEMYGLPVLGPQTPPATAEQKAAGRLFLTLHSIQDTKGLARRIVDGQRTDDISGARPGLDNNSVGEIEDFLNSPKLEMPSTGSDELMRRHVQIELNRRESTRVLRAVRDHLYTQISAIQEWAIREVENQALLGPNYHIVIGNLDALGTGVGQELLAALDNLRSANPANWSLAALGCRNVILKLGRTLWPSEAESYRSDLAGRILDMKGERELNRLAAYMDWHYRKALGEDERSELRRLDEVARKIYGKGSGGKRGTELKLKEAQGLVIDTFQFVSELGQLVGLEPVSEDTTGS